MNLIFVLLMVIYKLIFNCIYFMKYQEEIHTHTYSCTLLFATYVKLESWYSFFFPLTCPWTLFEALSFCLIGQTLHFLNDYFSR